MASADRRNRVLVVEDSELNSRLLARILTRLGYEVDSVWNGEEATRAVCQKAYEIILMDLQMPVMNGFDAASWILNNPAKVKDKPKIIAVTANAQLETRQRCTEIGMVEFLAKPIDMDTLTETLIRIGRSKQ